MQLMVQGEIESSPSQLREESRLCKLGPQAHRSGRREEPGMPFPPKSLCAEEGGRPLLPGTGSQHRVKERPRTQTDRGRALHRPPSLGAWGRPRPPAPPSRLCSGPRGPSRQSQVLPKHRAETERLLSLGPQTQRTCPRKLRRGTGIPPPAQASLIFLLGVPGN